MKHLDVRVMAIVAATVTLGGHGSTRAAGPEAERSVNLDFHVLGTPRGEATYGIGSLSLGTATGDPIPQMHLKVFLDGPPEGAECSGTRVEMGMGAADFNGPNAPFLIWDVNATVEHTETDQIGVEYTWKRRLRSSDRRQDGGGHDKVVLKEDGRVLLDLVSRLSTDFPNDCYQNVAMELAASVREDAALADRRIAYDLWLVSENQGQRTTRRLSLIGRQGEKVRFDYGALRSSVEPLTPSEKESVLETIVNGQVRGRIQADGTVEVALRAERDARESEGHWATAAHGDKLVRAIAGETVRLELPPPPLRDAEHIPNAAAVEQAIAGHQVSLVLTATPMQ